MSYSLEKPGMESMSDFFIPIQAASCALSGYLLVLSNNQKGTTQIVFRVINQNDEFIINRIIPFPIKHLII